MDYRLFRRVDTGEIISVPFDQALRMDALGFITLEDGTQAQRCREPETFKKQDDPAKVRGTEPAIVSDALGFPSEQLGDMREHLARTGIPGIEFVPDKDVPQFTQVKCASVKAWRKYLKSRGQPDHNSLNGSGAAISPVQLERLEQRFKEAYPA